MKHEHAHDDPATTASEGAGSAGGEFILAEVGGLAANGVLGQQPFSLSQEPQAGFVGEFRIIREVGRGGMGVVYEAEQMSLGRRVALKILPMASVLDGRQLLRFKNEARAAATLLHPHIVPVYSIGCERGVHYYAMQFIEGRSLAEVIASLRTEAGLPSPRSAPAARAGSATGIREAELPSGEPTGGPEPRSKDPEPRSKDPEPRSKDPEPGAKSSETVAWGSGSTESTRRGRYRYLIAARWGADVAGALEHAHSLGVVHRDVKPGNLLLDQEGKVWVADFGLAQLEADAGMTMTGDVLGTLRYMSPEQTQGKRAQVDARSDVYSLGISLYELISLRPAFPGTDRAAVLRQVVEVDPPPLRSVDPQVPRDLETVVLKAIAKEPQARYASAKEFADDLRRFVGDEPIHARRPTLVDRGAKWARRHRALVGVALGVLVALCVLLSVSLSVIERERARAVANGQTAERAAKEKQRLLLEAQQLQRETARHAERIERLLYGSDLKLAALAWEKGDLQQYVNLLAAHQPGTGSAKHRGFEWNYLWRRGMLEHRAYVSREGAVHAARFSPDGKRIAIGCEDGDALLFSAAAKLRGAGKLQPPPLLVRAATERATSVAFSPDGGRLATACYDGTISVHNLETGNLEWEKAVYTDGQAADIVFSSDGQGLLTCGLEPLVRVWDAADGRPRGELRSETPPLPNRRQAIHALAVSGDGQMLASAGGPDGHTLMIWNLPAQTEKLVLRGHQERLTSVAFSPDRRLVATGSIDRTVRLWDLSGERSRNESLRREVFVGEHLDSVRSVAFSPDGRWLATGDWNGAIRLWDLESLGIDALQANAPVRSANPARIWQAHAGRVHALDFAPDAPRLLSAGRDGKVQAWNLESQPRRSFPAPEGRPISSGGSFTPDGRLMVRAQEDCLAFWDLVTDQLAKVVEVQLQPRRSLALSPRDSHLYFGNGPGTVEVWDLRNRKFVARWRADGPQAEIDPQAISPDGSTLAATDWSSGVLWLFDTATGKSTAIPAPQCHDAVFLRNGAEVAVDSLDDVVIWNVAEQREVARLRGHNSTIESLAVSPDGWRLASCGQDRQVKIWDLQTNRQLHLLSSHRQGVTAVTFSPDGRSVVSGDRGGVVLVWDLESGRLVCELEKLAAEICRLEFSPEGDVLACYLLKADQAVVLLDVSPHEVRFFPEKI